MAIRRLSKIIEQVDEPFRNHVRSLQKLLENRMNFIVEGSWVPDNVIHDNNPGHIWKYTQPFLLLVPKVPPLRDDHGTTEDLDSLMLPLAKKTYAWDKLWLKRSMDGTLVDRCQAMQMNLRDMFLLREDEMRDLAATICMYLSEGSENWAPLPIFDRKDFYKVSTFLFDPSRVTAFYEGLMGARGEKSPEHKKMIRRYKRDRSCMDLVMPQFREAINDYIIRHIGIQYVQRESSMFPLYSHEDQLALHFFSLGHYIADTHMPLHCDIRRFSRTGADIHGAIEDIWESWIITPGNQRKMGDIVSEYERANLFLSHIIRQENKINYPITSPLHEIQSDDELSNLIWRDRSIPYRPDRYTTVWDDMVGVAYVSYCLGSRLLRCDDEVVALPLGDDETAGYLPRTVIDVKYGQPRHITKATWMKYVHPFSADELDEIFASDRGNMLLHLHDLCGRRNPGANKSTFEFLSLAILLDAVDRVAITWARVAKDHFNALERPDELY